MIVYRMISYFKEIVNRYQVILERFPKLLFYIFLRELGAEVVVLCYIFTQKAPWTNLDPHPKRIMKNKKNDIFRGI